MVPNPHDLLVKKILSIKENAVGELRTLLPAELEARIDWSTLALDPNSHVDEKGREWHTDLVFTVELDGREAILYLLLEHQSRADRWMPLRLLIYISRIWADARDNKSERLPVVIPMVIHHGKRPWSGPRRLADLMDADEALLELLEPFVPDFEFLLDDLIATDEPELLERPMTSIAKLMVWALRAVRLGRDVEVFETWLRELEAALSALPSGGEALGVFFVYLSEVDGGAPLLEAILEADIAAEVREIAMGLRKKWVDEARVEGRVEGRLERGAEALLKLLRLKFGAFGTPIEKRVRSGSEEDHDRWTARVLTAESLEEVFLEAHEDG